MEVKISIIVPVYNVEKYLKKCLTSLTNQTLNEIEIICVNDASPDACGKILKSYAEMDERIKIVNLKENQGTLIARILGMEQASGQYIMFVDSDDYLEHTACEELYQIMKETNADVVHFGTYLHVGTNVSKELEEWVEHFLAPYKGKITNGNLEKSCFGEEKFDFNIWNKIWKREVCLKAFSYIQKKRLIASEDRYIFFLLLYFVRIYYGIQKKYYHYNLGIGVTGGDTLTLEQFEKRCSGALAADLVNDFLIKVPFGENFREVSKDFANKILWDCVDCWHNKLNKEDFQEGFQILRKYFQPNQLISAIARFYFENGSDIIRRIFLPKGKRVAIFYRYLGYDNMDHKLAEYISSLREMECEIFLYTDNDRKTQVSNKYADDAEIVYLPDSSGANWDQYEARCVSLYEQLKKDRIEILIYASPTSHVAWLDRLLAELSSISVIDLPDELFLERHVSQDKNYTIGVKRILRRCLNFLKYHIFPKTRT